MGQPQCLGAIICAWGSVQHKDSPIHELVEEDLSLGFGAVQGGLVRALPSDRGNRLVGAPRQTYPADGEVLLKGEFGGDAREEETRVGVGGRGGVGRGRDSVAAE